MWEMGRLFLPFSAFPGPESRIARDIDLAARSPRRSMAQSLRPEGSRNWMRGDEPIGRPIRGRRRLAREEDMMTAPQPIREIAPPAWPLPLIASEPKGPRRGA